MYLKFGYYMAKLYILILYILLMINISIFLNPRQSYFLKASSNLQSIMPAGDNKLDSNQCKININWNILLNFSHIVLSYMVHILIYLQVVHVYNMLWYFMTSFLFYCLYNKITITRHLHRQTDRQTERLSFYFCEMWGSVEFQ